jgi:glycosyltransferase involved in cell wall biosynthesis
VTVVRPLRVLHVIPSMASGGAERQVAVLARGLRRRGLDVHVAHFAGGPNLPLLERSGAVLHRLPQLGNHDPLLLLRLGRLIRRLRPDVVQTWLTMANVLGGIVAPACGVPWVFAERFVPSGFGGSSKSRLEQWLARARAAAVVSNSERADAEWAMRLGPATRRLVIRNALPLDEIDAAPAADPSLLGLPLERPLLLFVGRLREDKGVPVLLEALAMLVRERPLGVLVLGEGPLEEEVRAQVRSGRLGPHASAPGFRSDAVSWMKAASLVVSLSRIEGMPNSVIEAMAAGCPLVVSDIPQHREILDASSATLVPLDDARATADAVRAVLDDPTAAAERARRARARAEAWSLDATSAAYATLYEELAGRRTRGA